MKTEKQNYLVSVPRGVEVSAIGLKITTKLSYEQWSALVESLQRAHRSLLWFIGDALVWGEENFGEAFSQVISEHSKQVQYNAAWVSRQIEISRRREILSWSHHYEVAKLDAREQDAFLEAAIDNGWSTRELREAVRHANSASGPRPQVKTAALTSAHESFDSLDLESAKTKKIERSFGQTIEVRSISEKAIQFLKGELEGANPQDVARVIDSIVHAFAEDLADDWDEAEILRTKSGKELIAISRVKSSFAGGRVLS